MQNDSVTNPELIYDDPHIQVLYQPGSSPFSLLTFTEFGFRANGLRFWADKMCEKHDIACIGLASHRSNWFPAGSVQAASASIRALGHARLVGYGHSMGGYAALKYSAMLGLTGAIASCPQFTIDPKRIFHQPAYTACFDPALHADMDIRREDVSGHVIVLHDPFFADDKIHMDMLRQACGGTFRELAAAYIGHSAPMVLRHWPLMHLLIETALSGESLVTCKTQYRSAKKTEFRYRVGLAEALFRTHSQPGCAAKVLEAAQAGPDHAFETKRLGLLRDVYLALGRKEHAVLASRQAVELEPSNPHLKALLAGVLLSNGDLSEAEQAYRTAIALLPKATHFYLGLSDCLMRQKKFVDALQLLETAAAAGLDNDALNGRRAMLQRQSA
jgi:hypothetical protein